MMRNVLKPDGTVHIEQQVANMRYDLTTGQVETVVPGAGATNLVFGADGRQHVELTTGNRYTYSQIKNDLVGKDGKADAATKLETDYLAQILLPSIKAQD
mgnify:CR=1 FL=1